MSLLCSVKSSIFWAHAMRFCSLQATSSRPAQYSHWGEAAVCGAGAGGSSGSITVGWISLVTVSRTASSSCDTLLHTTNGDGNTTINLFNPVESLALVRTGAGRCWRPV